MVMNEKNGIEMMKDFLNFLIVLMRLSEIYFLRKVEKN